jgi:hypothetical protein
LISQIIIPLATCRDDPTYRTISVAYTIRGWTPVGRGPESWDLLGPSKTRYLMKDRKLQSDVYMCFRGSNLPRYRRAKDFWKLAMTLRRIVGLRQAREY